MNADDSAHLIASVNTSVYAVIQTSRATGCSTETFLKFHNCSGWVLSGRNDLLNGLVLLPWSPSDHSATWAPGGGPGYCHCKNHSTGNAAGADSLRQAALNTAASLAMELC